MSNFNTMARETYTITDKHAIELIESLLKTFPIGSDEPIDGSDAVDALAEIKTIVDRTHFLPRKRRG